MEKQFLKVVKEKTAALSILFQFLELCAMLEKQNVLQREEFESLRALYTKAIRDIIGVKDAPKIIEA